MINVVLAVTPFAAFQGIWVFQQEKPQMNMLEDLSVRVRGHGHHFLFNLVHQAQWHQRRNAIAATETYRTLADLKACC